MRDFKVGDFVKHKDGKSIIFQIVQILESANINENDCRMINCIRVTDIYSYLETDLCKYELTDNDSTKIIHHEF